MWWNTGVLVNAVAELIFSTCRKLPGLLEWKGTSLPRPCNLFLMSSWWLYQVAFCCQWTFGRIIRDRSNKTVFIVMLALLRQVPTETFHLLLFRIYGRKEVYQAKSPEFLDGRLLSSFHFLLPVLSGWGLSSSHFSSGEETPAANIQTDTFLWYIKWFSNRFYTFTITLPYLNPENLSQVYGIWVCSVQHPLVSVQFHLLSFYEVCSWWTWDSVSPYCSSSHQAHSGPAGPGRRTALGTGDVNMLNSFQKFRMTSFIHHPK